MGEDERKMTDKTSIKAKAEGLLDEGRLDEAIAEYRALIELDVDDPCSHFGLCDSYNQKGMLDEALYEIDEAIRLRPGWPLYHNKKGKILEGKGDQALALIEFKAAVAIKPDLEDALKSIRRIERKMKRKSPR